MATISGLVEAASMLPVSVVTGGEARPSTTARVLWIGGTTKPSFMIEGDVWFRVATSGPAAPEILTTTLNTMTQSSVFSQALSMNGTPPYTFEIVSGSLPSGITIHSVTGVISGTPTTAGSYSFGVRVTNAVGNVTKTFSGTVTASVVSPLITTTTLLSLTQGSAFTQTIQASGTGPLTWTVSAGTLPSGLTLNSSNGTITGSPTGSGSYSFTLQATNTAGNDTQVFTGTVASSGTAPVITTTTLSSMQASISFNQVLNKTGSSPMTWGISTGTIPAGLSINSTTGTISGTPTTDGSYSFTVSATNSFGSDTQAYSGTIATAPVNAGFSTLGNSDLTLTSYSDAGSGAWVAQQFYQSDALTALPSGAKIIGARLYVPVGSAHIGQLWYGALKLRPTGFWPTGGSFPYAEFNSNGTKKTGSLLVSGWNEVLFDAEWAIPAQGGSWLIGAQIGDGTRYLHSASNPTAAAIQNPEGKNIFMSAQTSRCFYNGDLTTGAYSYGIDVLVKIP